MGDNDVQTAAVRNAVSCVQDALEGVFASLGETQRAIASVAAEARRDGTSVSRRDLAVLQPLIFEHLRSHAGLIIGTGFVAEPEWLSDAPLWIEWFQRDRVGGPARLSLGMDPTSADFYDYTRREWWTAARETRKRVVHGPYVDWLGIDEYALTMALPVVDGEHYLGVAGADLYVRDLEAIVTPALRRIPCQVGLVNAQGRVVASNTARRVTGSLIKGADFAAALRSGAPMRSEELALYPCQDLPLIVVTSP